MNNLSQLNKLNTPTYQESTKLSNYQAPKPYEKQELKPKQEETITQATNLKPYQEISTDPLAEKLAQLK